MGKFTPPPEGMKNFFFTFSLNHLGKNGESLRKRYAVIPAKDIGYARNEMFRLRGAKWAWAYTSAQQAGVYKHNLKEIELKDIEL